MRKGDRVVVNRAIPTAILGLTLPKGLAGIIDQVSDDGVSIVISRAEIIAGSPNEDVCGDLLAQHGNLIGVVFEVDRFSYWVPNRLTNRISCQANPDAFQAFIGGMFGRGDGN